MNEKFSRSMANKAKQQARKGEFEDDILEIFMVHFMDTNEMPYTVQKARDGDPYEWTAQKLDSMGTTEINKLVDTITESDKSKSDSIKTIFEQSHLKEGMSNNQIAKALDRIDDELNRIWKLTDEKSNLFKSYVEAGGDPALLKSVHKLISDASDTINDSMMSFDNITNPQ